MNGKPDSNANEDLALKSCCANVYQSDWAKLILGDSFHPGGIALTEYLGTMLQLGPEQRVLDVAAGQGTSAIHLAQRFGCSVLGIDYGETAMEGATLAAQKAGVTHLVTFVQGDAEHLPVPDASFDAVICECAFCTFPNKAMAAAEFTRILRPGGQLGLSDLTRQGEIPHELQGLLAWIACIADAQPLDTYLQHLTAANLSIQRVEPHDEALSDMVRNIQAKLMGTELLVKLKKIELPSQINFEEAKNMAKAAATSIKAQQFGYALITATKA